MSTPCFQKLGTVNSVLPVGNSGKREAIAKRISGELKKTGLSLREIGARLGVSHTAVKKWMDGKTLPEGLTLTRLCEEFDLSASYLLGLDDQIDQARDAIDALDNTVAKYGVDEFMQRVSEDTHPSIVSDLETERLQLQFDPPSPSGPIDLDDFKELDHDEPRDTHVIYLDSYEAVPAGGLSAVEPEQIGKWPVLHSMANENYKVIRVYGDSMAYRIRDRDLVLINTDIHTPKNGDVVSAIYEGQTTLKRFQRVNGKTILLADNPDHIPRVIEIDRPEELFIVGVVEAIVYREIE